MYTWRGMYRYVCSTPGTMYTPLLAPIWAPPHPPPSLLAYPCQPSPYLLGHALNPPPLFRCSRYIAQMTKQEGL
jgi:hypothetical protein